MVFWFVALCTHKVVTNVLRKCIVCIYTLKIEALFYPEPLVTAHKASRRHNKEKDYPHFHYCVNLKSHLTHEFMKSWNIAEGKICYKRK